MLEKIATESHQHNTQPKKKKYQNHLAISRENCTQISFYFSKIVSAFSNLVRRHIRLDREVIVKLHAYVKKKEFDDASLFLGR